MLSAARLAESEVGSTTNTASSLSAPHVVGQTSCRAPADAHKLTPGTKLSRPVTRQVAS